MLKHLRKSDIVVLLVSLLILALQRFYTHTPTNELYALGFGIHRILPLILMVTPLWFIGVAVWLFRRFKGVQPERRRWIGAVAIILLCIVCWPILGLVFVIGVCMTLGCPF